MAILLTVAISNIPVVSFFISFFTKNLTMMGPDYHFISGQGGFSVWGRGGGYEETEALFEQYKKRHPSDSTLYRNFKISPWQFWRISEYFGSKAYRLEYKEPPANLSYKDIIR